MRLAWQRQQSLTSPLEQRNCLGHYVFYLVFPLVTVACKAPFKNRSENSLEHIALVISYVKLVELAEQSLTGQLVVLQLHCGDKDL